MPIKSRRTDLFAKINKKEIEIEDISREEIIVNHDIIKTKRSSDCLHLSNLFLKSQEVPEIGQNTSRSHKSKNINNKIAKTSEITSILYKSGKLWYASEELHPIIASTIIS